MVLQCALNSRHKTEPIRAFPSSAICSILSNKSIPKFPLLTCGVWPLLLLSNFLVDQRSLSNLDVRMLQMLLDAHQMEDSQMLPREQTTFVKYSAVWALMIKKWLL